MGAFLVVLKIIVMHPTSLNVKGQEEVVHKYLQTRRERIE
jgi:hypothetical protein